MSQQTERRAAKDPEDWTTGDEPMTGLTKAEASKRIDELQEETGRGR